MLNIGNQSLVLVVSWPRSDISILLASRPHNNSVFRSHLVVCFVGPRARNLFLLFLLFSFGNREPFDFVLVQIVFSWPDDEVLLHGLFEPLESKARLFFLIKKRVLSRSGSHRNELVRVSSGNRKSIHFQGRFVDVVATWPDCGVDLQGSLLVREECGWKIVFLAQVVLLDIVLTDSRVIWTVLLVLRLAPPSSLLIQGASLHFILGWPRQYIRLVLSGGVEKLDPLLVIILHLHMVCRTRRQLSRFLPT